MFLEMNLIFLIMYYSVICTVNTVRNDFLGVRGLEGCGYDSSFFLFLFFSFLFDAMEEVRF